MMLERQNLRFMQGKYLYGSALLLLISMVAVALSVSGPDEFDLARREILIRKIGHELLLQSGDSVSRVLPVHKISDNEFELSFEHAFGFLPDSLVSTTQRILGHQTKVPDYVVNVLNCGTNKVTYGFAIANRQKDDIVTCKGRMLPKDCYRIQIKFKDDAFITARSGYLLGSIPILAFIGVVFFRLGKPAKRLKELPAQDSDLVSLGSFLFDARNRKLMMHETVIDLTATESRVLRIFALSPNVAVERSRIQKEIWEDEGVIVGRSLDVFISKLRKKLELDERVKIVVIRGMGYRLEVG